MARRVESINDGWVFVPGEMAPDQSWEHISSVGEPVGLPHTWNAVDGQDGGNDYRRGVGTYVRRLEVAPSGGETWLEFAGANSSARVYLGGREVGRHDGGYSTFRVDLTSHLTHGDVLVVAVDNAGNDTVYPQRADFTFYGGIYRDVRLIHAAPDHFVLDEHGGPGIVVTPRLAGPDAVVELLATTTGGQAVRFGIAGVGAVEVPVEDGSARAELVIEDVRRWHGLRDPHLYLATAELLVDGEVVDKVEVRFGCREFGVDPEHGFLLNGEPYPLRGVSRHQDWEGVGNAITREMMRTDLDLILELGATTVRLAHYQHDQHFLDLCDETGLVVWAEIPQITEFLPTAKDNARDQLTELIVQNRHHPSIVCWGLSNEITVTGVNEDLRGFHRELDALAHELDPTRLTAMAHMFLLPADDPLVTVPDVMSYNLYYGWYVGEVEDNDAWLDEFHAAHPDVAVGLAEYGADANPRFQTADPVRGDYSEQFQARYHEHMLEMIEARPWLWATHVWNLADFAADGRDEGGLPGRNQKGLVTFDRSVKKDAFHLYRAAWSAEPVLHVCGRRRVERHEDVTDVTVYSNQPEVTLLLDGEPLVTRTGVRVFRFEVPIRGEHEITAVAGDLSDSIRLTKVAEPNADQTMAAATVLNWFDVELPVPEGFFSINDTLADIKSSEQGAQLVAHLMAGLMAKRGDVAQKVEIPEAMQAMLDRQSVASLIRQSGVEIPAEQLRELNAGLNRIPK